MRNSEKKKRAKLKHMQAKQQVICDKYRRVAWNAEAKALKALSALAYANARAVGQASAAKVAPDFWMCI